MGRGILTLGLLFLAGLVGAQEPWMYVKGSNTWVLYRPRKLSSYNVTDLRIGQIRNSIENVKLDGIECRLHTWHSEIWPHAGGPDVQLDFDTKTWVNLQGKVVRIEASHQKWTTLYKATAILKDDEVEITTESTKAAKKTTVLFPVGGTKLFDQAFKGLLFNEGVKPEDQTEYYLLDPIKGAPVKYTARVKNRVKGKFGDVEHEGLSVEITGPSGPILAYVNKQGELLQVDYDKGVRIYPYTYVPTVRQLEYVGFGGG